MGDRKLLLLLTYTPSLHRRNIQGTKVYTFLLVLQYPFDTEKIYIYIPSYTIIQAVPSG